MGKFKRATSEEILAKQKLPNKYNLIMAKAERLIKLFERTMKI